MIHYVINETRESCTRWCANWLYIVVYISGFPLIGVSVIQYGTSLPYVCMYTHIAICLDTLWLCYLLHQSRSVVLQLPKSKCISRYLINPNHIEYIHAHQHQHQHQVAQCIVCLEDYVLDELLIKLYCGHVYHRDCILSWLNTKGNCPVCRDMGSVRSIAGTRHSRRSVNLIHNT